ncbi:MAG: hypothetical protein GY726_12725, partial [Proteobacteria bacterium]|nr:hypothetical protein [Pseudomonadota bacterium]
MKTNGLRRYFLFTLTSLFTVAVLTACGGGGSSSTGSGVSTGSASISGKVNSGIAFNQSTEPGSYLLDVFVELMVPNAYAAGVSNVKVDLINSSNQLVDSMTTGADGEFLFSGLAPGTYTIQLTQGTQLNVSQDIQLQENARTRVEMGINGGVMGLEVKAQNGQISGEVEDGISNDDQNST